MTKIKIIRHSERLDYKHPFYWLLCFGYHWSDSPLTTTGHEMAKIKGEMLTKINFNPKNIYVSPYNRTMETATEIKAYFPDSEIIIEPLLAEYQPYFKHKITLYPEGIPTDFCGQKTEFKYPENYEQFISRVKFIIQQLINKNNEDLVIITHGEILKVLISDFQTTYPDIFLDCQKVSYLTTLSFEYDENKNILEKSISIEHLN
ncbi:phosphoglycerate mutase family protein [Acanthamoeba polyphaga moumouvirus]|uniref:Phosphoglycerate mutase family protein n=1 Tax=Acanthamoeba polyphaga moumouvirus TaxID=1269028 RepID=L7RCL1_9VIRU|nr:phosphoglycerate mutase family protein [Acanthamoeba polyphaga moumouvirus]AGC01733.1 phosphoglycerate mutase family protein [Acanthamoeba polyphaga moumouvirus]AQN68078.1 phosphoglycerate mutase family protein [Saudi moumouvirus]